MSKNIDIRACILAEILKTYVKYNPFFNVFLNSKPEAEQYRNYGHQMYLIARLIFQRPIRVLIADEIGLGKTVEAIRLLKHLMSVGGLKRALIIVPPTLLEQWKEPHVGDLWAFGIEPVVIDRETISKLEKIPAEEIEGVFIGSMDTLKWCKGERGRGEDYPYFDFISSIDWNVIIIDEAHKLSYYSVSGPTLRYERLGAILSKKARHYVLLSATPHKGFTDDFMARLILLDRSISLDPKDAAKVVEERGLSREIYRDISDVIFFRRTKEDVNAIELELTGREVFREAIQYPVIIHVPPEIEELQNKVLFFATKGLEAYYVDPKYRGLRELLRRILIKRALSSLEALLKTFMSMSIKRTIPEWELERELTEVEKYRGFIEKYIRGEEDLRVEIDEKIKEICNRAALFVDTFKREEYSEEIRQIIAKVRELMEKGICPKINALITLVKLSLGLPYGESSSIDEKLKDVIQGRMIVFTEFRDTASFIFGRLPDVLKKELGLGSIPADVWERYENLVRDKRYKKAADYIRIIPTPYGCIGLGLLTSETKHYLKAFQELLADNRLATAILIATDVAAEGLNMQTANIVVNYEVTWSPLRREQRLGRVWRLGQRRTVYAFDLYLATDFERLIAERFHLKLLTMTEEIGHTTINYSGLAFYVPEKRTANGQLRHSLMIVEFKEYDEFRVIGKIAEQLKRALTPEGKIDIERFARALDQIAQEIINAAKCLKSVAEELERYRTRPDDAVNETEKLLSFRSDKGAAEAIAILVKELTKLVPDVEIVGSFIYSPFGKYNLEKFREITILAEKLSTHLLRVRALNDTICMHVKGLRRPAYLTILEVVSSCGDLYREPVLLVASQDETVRLFRGIRMVRKLIELLKEAYVVPCSASAHPNYEEAAMIVISDIRAIERIIIDKPIKFIRSDALRELRGENEPDMIPNINEPQVRLAKQPLAIFLPSLSDNVVWSIIRRVSPEKKEAIKTVSEELVKRHFEQMGYKMVRPGEYYPYDFEMYLNDELVYYVEVKGHETNALVAELSECEKEFAERHPDKYLVCIVTEVFTNPKIFCVKFSDLNLVDVRLVSKYIYKPSGGKRLEPETS